MLLGLFMMYPLLIRDGSMCINTVSKLYILSIYNIYWYFVYVFLSHGINVCVLGIICCWPITIASYGFDGLNY